MSTATRHWRITYWPPGAAGVDVWAVVTDVPAEIKGPGVLTAIEAWSGWPAWQARVRAGGVLRAVRVVGEVPAGTRFPWETLEPLERRISTPLPGELYSAVSRTARSRGLSLAEFVRDALTAATAASGVDDVAGVQQ